MAVEVAVKRCSKCGQEKPLDEFSRYPTGTPRSWCKRCVTDASQAHHAARRARLGDEAFLAIRRAAVRRSRQKAEVKQRNHLNRDAYRVAEMRVREAHRDEFETYLAEERAARGLT